MPVAPTLGTFEYTCESDRALDPEQRTVFQLRTLTWMEREDAVGDGQSTLAITRRVLNFALLGWKNFRDSDGSEVAFRRELNGKREILPQEILDRVQGCGVELANAVLDRTKVTEAQARNFTSP